MFLYRIGARISSCDSRRLLAPAAFPATEAELFADIVAIHKMVATSVVENDEAVGRSRVQFYRKRAVGLAVTRTGSTDAIASDRVAAEDVCNVAGIHHAITCAA